MIERFVCLPALTRGADTCEAVWIDASQVSSVCSVGDVTFVDCGKTTFRTNLLVDEVMELLDSVTQ